MCKTGTCYERVYRRAGQSAVGESSVTPKTSTGFSNGKVLCNWWELLAWFLTEAERWERQTSNSTGGARQDSKGVSE